MLQNVQKKLENQLNKSNLYHAMQHRPSIMELLNQGVYVPQDEVGPGSFHECSHCPHLLPPIRMLL